MDSPSACRALTMMSLRLSKHLLIRARLFLSSRGFITFLYWCVLDMGASSVFELISGEDPDSIPLSAIIIVSVCVDLSEFRQQVKRRLSKVPEIFVGDPKRVKIFPLLVNLSKHHKKHRYVCSDGERRVAGYSMTTTTYIFPL